MACSDAAAVTSGPTRATDGVTSAIWVVPLGVYCIPSLSATVDVTPAITVI